MDGYRSPTVNIRVNGEKTTTDHNNGHHRTRTTNGDSQARGEKKN